MKLGIIGTFFHKDKDNETAARKYAISTFRFYAKCGKPNHQELLDYLKENDGEKVLQLKGASLQDLAAVERALAKIAKKANGAEILKALEYVYFANPDRHLEKGDVALQVAFASIHIPASERQVYYWLREAVDIFCFERGLRAG